jgi:hypothetical protein
VDGVCGITVRPVLRFIECLLCIYGDYVCFCELCDISTSVGFVLYKFVVFVWYLRVWLHVVWFVALPLVFECVSVLVNLCGWVRGGLRAVQLSADMSVVVP